MSGLPTGWAEITVAEAGDARLGLQRAPARHTGSDMRPYLRVANVHEARIDLTDVKTMNFTEEERGRYRLLPGDILLNEGQSPEFLGRPAMWLGPVEEMYFTNSLIRFRAGPAVLPAWALLVFRHHMWAGRFSRESRITTNIAHLALGRFKTVEFPVPPLGEQTRIVEELERRLSHVDAAVRGMQVAMRQVLSARRAILNGVADGSLLEERGSSWRLVTAGEVCEVKGGIQKQPGRAPKSNRHAFLRVANVGRGSLNLDEIHEIELFAKEIDTYRLQKGDLLVVEGNGSVDQIGRAAMWDGSIEDCVTQNHLIRVRPRCDVDARFLALVWNAPTTIAQLTRVASSTSGLHTLSTGKVKSVTFGLPDLGVQSVLVQEADRRLSLLDAAGKTVERSLASAKQLRRSLLATAFTGELVPHDPGDEPARVLLKRTQAERSATPTTTRRKKKDPAA